jgi:hypothetical protein
MGILIKPSDLYFKYRRKKATREPRKFAGKPDPHPFDRDDLYEVIPMLAAVMDALDSVDGNVLHRAEEIMLTEMPSFIRSRAEVFDYLVNTLRDILED